MVNSAFPSVRQIGRFACVVLVGFAAVGAARIGAAEAQPGSTAQRIACAPDAYRLCADKIPNVAAITACMVQKKSKLSAVCRAVF